MESFDKSLFWKSYAWYFFALFIPLLFIYPAFMDGQFAMSHPFLTVILIDGVCSAVLSAISCFIANRIGNFGKLFYGVGRGERDFREQYSGDLSQARYHKIQGQFDAALRSVNEVLKRDPEFPEALFI